MSRAIRLTVAAAVVAEDDFLSRLEVSAFSVEHTSADAEGRVAVAVDEEDALVGETQGEVGVALET